MDMYCVLPFGVLVYTTPSLPKDEAKLAHRCYLRVGLPFILHSFCVIKQGLYFGSEDTLSLKPRMNSSILISDQDQIIPLKHS